MNSMQSSSSDNDVCDTTTPGLYTQIVGSAVFLMIWPLVMFNIKLFSLGRPAAVLVGATLMVLFTIVSQDEVYEIEGRHGNLQTVFLLVGVMLLSFYFDREGLLRLLALAIFGSKRTSMCHVLWKVCLLTGIMAAFITNDATSLVISPLLFIEFKRQGHPRKHLLPLALGIATSANIGSASTVFGNIQNAFISSSSGIPLIEFFKAELPAAIVGLALNTGLLYLIFYKRLFNDLTEEDERIQREERKRVYTAGLDLQSIAGSIIEERQASILDKDRSTPDPGLSSQIARERENMYKVESLRITSSQSHHSLHQLTPSFNLHSIGHSHSDHNIISAHHRHMTSLSHSPAPVLTEVIVPEIRVTHTISESSNDEDGGKEVVEVIKESEVVVVETYPDPMAEVIPLQERSRRELLFIAWLVFISIIAVVLLALPPPPVVSASFNLGLIPLGAAILTMLVDSLLNKRQAYEALSRGIDWHVIIMLMGLYVWLGGFQNTCIPHLIFEKLTSYMDLYTIEGVLIFTGFIILGTNIFSNVPLTILIIDKLPHLMCGSVACGMTSSLPGLLLAWTSTIAGNMTLIGSTTSLIVAEKAQSTTGYQLTFLRYTSFGLISSSVVILSGLTIVYSLARFTTIN